MTTEITDVIDHLVGTEPGSALQVIRSARPIARDNAQNSYEALFTPADPGAVSLAERFAVATFVAGLHGDTATAAFYRDHLAGLADAAQTAAIADAISQGQTQGPYGHYPAGPLTGEDRPGAIFTVSDANRTVLGNRLAAALDHAHLLVFRPRDSSPGALQALLTAGWSSDAIVTLSQLVAFLAFQIRVIVGLRALAQAQSQSDRTVAAE
jgi:CMD domain protein